MIIKKKCNKADGNYLSTDTRKVNLLGWAFTSSSKVTIRVFCGYIFFYYMDIKADYVALKKVNKKWIQNGW